MEELHHEREQKSGTGWQEKGEEDSGFGGE